MADCNDLFKEYNSRIRLTDYKRKQLKDARDNLRRKITSNIEKNGAPKLPVFHGQGSYIMDTIVNPIPGVDYDLDDGVYYVGDGNETKPSPTLVHQGLIDAIGNYTNSVIDKSTCVRVNFSEGFHIDFPMYFTSFYDPELADKKRGWILSNAIEFVQWFEQQVGSGFKMGFVFESNLREDYGKWSEDIRKKDAQLRRMVRYIKAWSQNQSGYMPPGIVLTILAAVNYSPDMRDDIAFLSTLERIKDALQSNYVCLRPTTPVGEDLFEKTNKADKLNFISALNQIVKDGESAVLESDKTVSAKIWQRHLGDRFPAHLAQIHIKKYSTVAPLKQMANGSEPWGLNY